jgi:hypothetical protein
MKEVEQRIHNYIEDINGRKFAKKGADNEKVKLDERGLPTDYGMIDGKQRATAFLKNRIKGQGGSF